LNAGGIGNRAYEAAVKKATTSCKTFDENFRWVASLPQYYRRLYEDPTVPQLAKVIIKPLMENNFKLDKKEFKAGEDGEYEDHFLFVEIADEDLPWDLNQSDW